jgi:hypothetical protein
MRTKQFTTVFWLLAASIPLLADISVEPAAMDVTVGQTFTLSVQATGVTDLYAYQFDIGFNSAVLSAISVSEGAFLPTGGATIFLPGTIDNVGGSITANADILDGAVAGVTGNGDLLDVTFHALTAGSSSVQVFNLFALDSFGLGLDLPIDNATVTVTAATTPEPGTWLPVSFIILGLLAFRYKRKVL